MHDIKYIRENPDAFDAAMQRRGKGAQSSSLLKLDEERRAIQTELQELQAKRNASSKAIGQAKAKGEDAQPILDEVATLGDSLKSAEANLAEVTAPLSISEF